MRHHDQLGGVLVSSVDASTPPEASGSWQVRGQKNLPAAARPMAQGSRASSAQRPARSSAGLTRWAWTTSVSSAGRLRRSVAVGEMPPALVDKLEESSTRRVGRVLAEALRRRRRADHQGQGRHAGGDNGKSVSEYDDVLHLIGSPARRRARGAGHSSRAWARTVYARATESANDEKKINTRRRGGEERGKTRGRGGG